MFEASAGNIFSPTPTVGGFAPQSGTNLISTIGNLWLGKKSHDLAQQNFQQQMAVYDYQKALQKQIFEREDNSIQRRVADLKAAGLSPILAAGQGARAGAAIPVTSPQKSDQGLKMASMALNDFAGRMLDVQKSKAEIDLIRAQTARTSQITRYEKSMQVEQLNEAIINNQFLKSTIEQRINEVGHQVTEAKAKAYIAQQNARMTQIDRDIKEHFDTWLRSTATQGKLVPIENNPIYQEYLSLRIMNTIKEYDYHLYKSLGQPYTGNMTEWGILGGLMNKLSGGSE